MTMKALMKKQPGEGLSMERVPIPTCNNSSVLIKISKAAICGTDVHIYNWDEWAQRTIKAPMIIGHEFVGEVVDKGADVKGIRCHAIGQIRQGDPRVRLR